MRIRSRRIWRWVCRKGVVPGRRADYHAYAPKISSPEWLKPNTETRLPARSFAPLYFHLQPPWLAPYSLSMFLSLSYGLSLSTIPLHSPPPRSNHPRSLPGFFPPLRRVFRTLEGRRVETPSVKIRGWKFSRSLAPISSTASPWRREERGKADVFIIGAAQPSNSPAVIRIIIAWWNYKVAWSGTAGNCELFLAKSIPP